MKQKINLSLSESELSEFRLLVDNSQINGLKNLVALLVDKDNIDEYIKRKVYEALSDLSGFDIDKIKDSQKLKIDLGLSSYHKKALKGYFMKILSDLSSEKIITVKECEDLEKVSDCIKLLKSKI